MARSDLTSLSLSPRLTHLTAALAAVCAFLAVGGTDAANAAVTCTFSGGALTIQNSSTIEEARIVRSGDNIVVNKGQNAVTCAGGQATVHNTHVIAHSDNSGGEAYFTIDLRGGPFAPGETNEPGNTDEIDIQALMGAGDDRLYIWGGPGDDLWRLGQTAMGVGVNLNNGAESAPGETPNSDVDLRDAEMVTLLSGSGNDHVLAGGGPEFSGPLPFRADVNADFGDDEVVGGNGRDNITDGDGNDRVSGGANDDSIVEWGPISGDDRFDGGPGKDEIGWGDFTGPMRVDLRLAGRQDTGAGGRDTLTGFENASTSAGNDVLIGTDGDNELWTGDGDDLVLALGGADRIESGSGSDTASYATPPAGVRGGVRVDLSKVATPQDTGGAGIDRLADVENLIGSPFADRLTGSLGNNRFDARDGAGDIVTCGAGADTVMSDVEGTDTIDTQCETVDFDFRPETAIDAAPPVASSDATPTFRFSATKPGSTFECSLDDAAFDACPADFSLAPVGDGTHRLRVRARDLLGALDLSPAERLFSVDTTPPRITQLGISTKRRLGFTLSEKATVKIAIARCVRLRGERCKRFRQAATLTRTGADGANRVAIARSLRRLRARGGLYRVAVVATDSVGNSSKPVRVRIARPRA